eukprot:gnl/TRDRNA2_/TRDRNA2_193017_c0_seq1.p1 gnl/TRDRNA2_/TRDRNA2_193017_c0~~gnl/TRDRNA2_/TRDRNA2_193017_c0_seq1.p1  ORF type:complete len:507 (-),score=74.02 gnl/TRDRNA2_/TRDRNA2_193017_c0_seq1:38-1558(-)
MAFCCICREDAVEPVSNSQKAHAAQWLEDIEHQKQVAPPLPKECQELFRWISDAEAEQCKKIREGLTREERAQLESEPEDIRHDLFLTRMLRGHGKTVAGALKSLKSHLDYRRQWRDVHIRARKMFTPKAEAFDADLALHSEQLADTFVSIQLAGSEGTKTGMQVSLLATQFSDLSKFGSMDQKLLDEWYISWLEQRNFCLHNQSVRLKRMCRVYEVRDCLGFIWSQLAASPLTIMKCSRTFGFGENYPELLGVFVMFNLEPGMRSLKIIKSFMREEFQAKCMFCERGDWGTLTQARGLNPSLLPRWAQHKLDRLNNPMGNKPLVLSSRFPQSVRSFEVSANEVVSWQITCKRVGSQMFSLASLAGGSNGIGAKPQEPGLKVYVCFFPNACPTPFKVAVSRIPVADASSRNTDGSFTAPAQGVVLLELELQGAEQATVTTNFSGSKQASPVARVRRTLSWRQQESGQIEDSLTSKKSSVVNTSLMLWSLSIFLILWVVVSSLDFGF